MCLQVFLFNMLGYNDIMGNLAANVDPYRGVMLPITYSIKVDSKCTIHIWHQHKSFSLPIDDPILTDTSHSRLSTSGY